MARMVALLRGINVGGHRRVPMADLRDLAGGIGLRGAETCIQSGNLVFEASLAPDAARGRLEEGIRERFGFPVDVVVRTAARWSGYAAANPFPAASAKEPERVMLLLGRERPRADGAAALAERAAAGETVRAKGDAVWIHYPEGVGRSKLAPALIDRLLGTPCTARNWKTVLAVRDLLRAARASPRRARS